VWVVCGELLGGWVGCGGFAGTGVCCAGERCPLGPTRIQGDPGVLGKCELVFVMVFRPLAFGRVVGGGGWKGAGVGVGVVCVNVVVAVRRGVVGACPSGWGTCCGLGIAQWLGWGVGVVFGV
jgi:hypothetical protein